jgi:flagellar motor switch protein FliN/FliY
MAKDADQVANGAADEKVNVQSAEFSELTDESQGAGLSLDLVLDISMPVTVELGRTLMTVQELLQLRTGSVVELAKMAGEPVDLLVRNVRFARGEVVVVDNNFGLRISVGGARPGGRPPDAPLPDAVTPGRAIG